VELLGDMLSVGLAEGMLSVELAEVGVVGCGVVV
jgi:hypothetical protein